MTPSQNWTHAVFQRRFLSITVVFSLITIGLISGYLALLLRLPREQWIGFAQIVAGFFVFLLPLALWASNKGAAGVTAHLRASDAGRDDDVSVEAAFRSLGGMPRFQFVSGTLWWFVGGALVGGAMFVRYESFGAFPAMVMVLAATSGGLVTSIFLFFVHKRAYAELYDALAARIADPVRRDGLVRPVSIRQKLVVAITGVTFVTVAFAMCLAYVASSRRLEEAATRAQAGLLEEWLVENGEEPELELIDSAGTVAALARRLAIADDLILIDPDGGLEPGATDSPLFPPELGLVLSGADSGVSLELDSPNVFAWRRIGESGPIAVAVRDWSGMGAGATTVSWIIGLMMLLAAGVSLALSRVLADDLGDTAMQIQAEVARMASGDLRTLRVLESEDELGALARRFEQTASSLRRTVGRVANAADRVDVTAADMGTIARDVSTGAVDQAEGVKQATKLMEELHGQVDGVSRSAQDLNLLVEESSSSILEMGAAGDELNDTAGVLLSKVDEVSSSIEQMVRSVKQIASNTDDLSEASVETSASMEEMASAMRQVDVTAEETARLSRAVVESAEEGHAKVRQTIAGMESIRSATETAERVIRGLGERALEIGAIVDVIDDVADETNLLALNAAIIAAQAGEQGRAFSVVADEIKELADRVLASTKEIGGLIRSVQTESANAVGAIEEGARSVASGVQLSMEAGSSLEDITRASRESGTRIQEIVQAVREQTKAAGHVVELMVRVSEGIQAIQTATSEQDRGNEVVFRSSVTMREVASQLRGTTEEQARGGSRIRESIDGVREAVEAINRAIQIQSESNSALVGFLEEVSSRTASNELSAGRLEQVSRELREQSEDLHRDVRQFQI